MAIGPMITFAIADENIAAWFFLQHESKILGAHGWFGLRIDLVVPDERMHDIDCNLRFLPLVDHRRIVAVETKFQLRAECSRSVLRNVVHALLDQVKHFNREGAHGPNQASFIWYDIGGAASVDLRNGQHGGIDRIAVARNDGLQLCAIWTATMIGSIPLY